MSEADFNPSIYTQVEIQSNGIIRNSKGLFMARLDRDVDIELLENDTRDARIAELEHAQLVILSLINTNVISDCPEHWKDCLEEIHYALMHQEKKDDTEHA